MSRFKLLGFAAISWLPFFSLITAVHADTYDLQSNWAQTYPTSTSVSSGNDTWGITGGTASQATAWQAGLLSFNSANQLAVQGTSGPQYLLDYYLPATSTISTSSSAYSGSAASAYSYTVPFASYALVPGQTIQPQVGPWLANQINTGKPEIDSSGNNGHLTLPTGITVGYATTSTGALQYITHVENGVSASMPGFATTSFGIDKSYSDGGGSVQGTSWAAVMYNYGAANASTGAEGPNAPQSSTSNSLYMADAWGPTYIAWTAPQGGYVTIGLQVNDLQGTLENGGIGGDPGFYIIDPSKGNFEAGQAGVTGQTGGITGPADPGLLFSAPNLGFPGAGGDVGPSDMTQSGPNTILGGTLSDYGTVAGGAVDMGTGYVPGAYGSATPTHQGSNMPTVGLSWISGTNAMYVTTGETLFFVGDPATGYYSPHSSHAAGYGKDPLALNVNIVLQTVPEPGSALLLAMAGVGLALTAWKRRRRISG